jgi:Zn-finger protein
MKDECLFFCYCQFFFALMEKLSYQ